MAGTIRGEGYTFETGVLTISINNGTTNWKSDSNISASSVQSVVLGSGVTAIGNEAFRDCTGLTQVSLPNSLTSIGSFAFARCVNLELTTLPSGNVTAVSPGSATITVTTAEGGKTATCAVNVETGSSSSGSGGGGSSSSGPSYIRRVLTDKNTGMMVAGDRIHEYAALNVKAGALHKAGDMGCALLRTAQTAGRVLCIYDVSLSRAFLGTVTVSIPVEGRDGKTLTIAHCIDGKLALSDVKVKSGSAELQVKEPSPFAVLNGVYTSDTLAAPVDLTPGTSKPKRYRVQKGDTENRWS